MGTTTGLAGDALREPEGENGRHEALLVRVAPRLRRYFRKRLGHESDAEELLQRTLVALEITLRKRSYDPARSFNGWIWLKAHTALAQWFRERSRDPKPLSAVVPEPQVLSPHEREVQERLDVAHVLREVHRRLGEECCKAFVLHHEKGRTQLEIARELGRDPKTISSRLREARALIRSLLDPKS